MLNVTSKITACILAAASLLASCGDANRRQAEELYTLGKASVAAGDYAKALAVIDTLDSRYGEQTDIRRRALRVRASAIEGIALDSIAAGDSALAVATIARTALDGDFSHIDSSVGLEGYFLPNGVSDKVMTTSGIQGRVSDKGYFYIVANVQGRTIGLNSFEIVDGVDRISSAQLSPARIIKVEGSESASFNPEELEQIGPWLENHLSASKLILAGSKGNVSLPLKRAQVDELVKCYRYASALQAQRRASVNREKYERMLATARDQLANLSQDTDE